MYGHVDRVAILINDFYHFLIAVSLWHSHESAKLAYAMVYMHHIVAYFKLSYFLKRERHFAVACLVGAQVVLMEAVEYLMVGEET